MNTAVLLHPPETRHPIRIHNPAPTTHSQVKPPETRKFRSIALVAVLAGVLGLTWKFASPDSQGLSNKVAQLVVANYHWEGFHRTGVVG